MRRLVEALKEQGALIGSVVLLWRGIEIVDSLLLADSLQTHGIRPRTAAGLEGIALAPFLHGGFLHLAANTVPFVVLGWVLLLSGYGRFFAVTAIAALVGGLGTWLVGGGGTNHIGASGVVFGYLGYLLFAGVYRRSLRTILTSIVIGLSYGGMVLGVLPGVPGISWEGHLFGFLGGWLAAFLLARAEREPPQTA